MTRDVLERELVDHVVAAGSNHLSAETTEAVQRCFLDTLGVVVAGSSGADIDRLRRLARPGSTGRVATTLVWGERCDALDAVWLNGAMARAWEYDDSHDPSGEHSSVPVFAAALGAVEMADRDIDGATFVRAYALGVDVAARLRLATTAMLNETGFATNTYAPFAAATAAAVIFGLDHQQTYDALGWAYAQCAGSVQAQQSSGSTLHVHHGLAASTGLQAAVLARAGLPGTPEFLTGKFGFFHNYCRDRFDLARATEGLGCRFEVERVSPKLYPSGRVTHGAVDAALALYHEAGVRPEEIKGITIRYSRLGYTMTCEPASERRYPTRAHHATFSLYYNVATALAHGRVDLDSFTDSAIADATTRAVSETIEVVIDESIHALLPIVMEARLTSGETITRTVTELAGSPESPASWARYLEKFYHCVDHAAVPIDAESREQMVKAASSLAEFSNLRVELLPALAGPSGADARREPGPESGARS